MTAQAETQRRRDAAPDVQAARLPRSAAAEHASGGEAVHDTAADATEDAAAAADEELLLAPRMLCFVAAAHGAGGAPLADATNTRQ